MRVRRVIVSSIAAAAVVVGAFVAGRAFAAGEGASQKWVAFKLAQSETNTLAEVEKRLVEFSAQQEASVDAIIERLGETNENYSVEQAIDELSRNATPTVNAIFDSVVTIAPTADSSASRAESEVGK